MKTGYKIAIVVITSVIAAYFLFFSKNAPAKINIPGLPSNDGSIKDMKIKYISPRTSNGGFDFSKIEIRTLDERFIHEMPTEGYIKIKGTNYPTSRMRYYGIWTPTTGGGSFFVNTPFIDSNETNSLGNKINYPLDGTVSYYPTA